MPHSNPTAMAALSALIILQAVMLGALYAGISPHPPAATPLFGIAPLLGASMAAAVAAMVLGAPASAGGRTLGCLAVIMSLISFGPQKYFDAQFGLIWPAVIAGQFACGALLWEIIRALRLQAEARKPLRK